MKKQTLISLGAAIGLYTLTTGVSAWSFGAFHGKDTSTITRQQPAGESKLAIDPSEPKDQPCPTNGQYFTSTERRAWEQLRPALVMVENSTDARPQSGLSSADIVYEAVAEGGITRFMGVFYCGAVANPGKVAPVRSARIYFVNLAAEYNAPIYVHVGGGNCSRDQGSGECTSDKRAWALEELSRLGWRKAKGNDFDTISDVGKPVLYRDASRLGNGKDLAVEHTMIGSLPHIWQEAIKRGFTGKDKDGRGWEDGFTPWKFVDGATIDDRGSGNKISFGFWDGYDDFNVVWDYDAASSSYKRATGEQAHADLENGQQLTASNVVIQLVKEEGPIDSHKHMLYQVIGKGKALVFQNGKVIDGSWEKLDQFSRTRFLDKNNQEISFVRGPIWVEIVPAGNEISY